MLITGDWTDPTALPSPEALGLSRLVHHQEVASTMDEAHALASAGAPAGVVVIADRQVRGRGRGGQRWESSAGDGLWMTLIERPSDEDVVGVLSLRMGLALAEALDALADGPVSVKWPNDVYRGRGKLAGILIEARWRDAMVDWVAIGVGINRRVPSSMPQAATIRADVSRATLLAAVVPGMRAAAARQGPLSAEELEAWHRRDMARGRRIRLPVDGVVAGISADGALLVERGSAIEPESFRAGSLVFADAEHTL
jgi:BirA family biotin operon repressor/biotin-[acetyl-CoA-carboxylase] ligase